jgi:hypothetical protein
LIILTVERALHGIRIAVARVSIAILVSVFRIIARVIAGGAIGLRGIVGEAIERRRIEGTAIEIPRAIVVGNSGVAARGAASRKTLEGRTGISRTTVGDGPVDRARDRLTPR